MFNTENTIMQTKLNIKFECSLGGVYVYTVTSICQMLIELQYLRF